jgi:hypothetical protein
LSVGRVKISRGCRRYVREWSRAVIYRPVEGVDWDFMRSIPEFGFVGNDVETGRSGGNFDEVLDGPGVDEEALV